MESDKIKCYIIIKVAIVCISLVNGSSEFKVSITPTHVHIKPNEEQTISCSSETPVKRCEIRVFDLQTPLPTLLPVVEDNRNDLVNQSSTMSVENESHGCTITLRGVTLRDERLYAVACRARTDTSVWSYAFMSVYKSNTATIDLNINSKQMVAGYFTNADVSIKSSIELQCYMYFRNTCFCMDKQRRCSTCNVYKKPYQGIMFSHCGITVPGVSESENGIFTFLLQEKSSKTKSFVLLTVTKPPNPVMLSYEVSPSTNGSGTLTATCTSSGSQPAANMTWYLATESLPAEHLRNLVHDGWLWPFNEQTTSQELTLTLTNELVGKEVKCQVSHVALSATQEATLKITEDFMTVPSPPTRDTTTIQLTNMTSSGVSRTDADKDHRLLEAIEKKINIWLALLTVLLIILFIIIVTGILRYYCRCYKLREKGSVIYRRSLENSHDSSGHVGLVQSPCPLQNSRTTASSLSQSSATTGVEFAEIRASMVQRCVDKLNDLEPRPSSETGELVVDTMHRNSMYMSYGDQPM